MFESTVTKQGQTIDALQADMSRALKQIEEVVTKVDSAFGTVEKALGESQRTQEAVPQATSEAAGAESAKVQAQLTDLNGRLAAAMEEIGKQSLSPKDVAGGTF